ncbi:uncharacterized protein LOC144784831 isoform X1 [Lissotriton helveticus]
MQVKEVYDGAALLSDGNVWYQDRMAKINKILQWPVEEEKDRQDQGPRVSEERMSEGGECEVEKEFQVEGEDQELPGVEEAQAEKSTTPQRNEMSQQKDRMVSPAEDSVREASTPEERRGPTTGLHLHGRTQPLHSRNHCSWLYHIFETPTTKETAL